MSEENKNQVNETTAAPAEGAVDFENPESVAAALAAQNEAELTGGTTKPKKERKPAGPKIVKVSFTADRDIKAGETVEFDYELPASARRGAVVGIPLEEMTDDQLKIEYRNANSVFYKTNKAGRDTAKSKARLDAVKAEMAKRGIQHTSRGSHVTVDANTVAELIKSGKISVDDIQRLLDGDTESAGETAESGGK